MNIMMIIADKAIFKVKTSKNSKNFHFLNIILININVKKECFK